MYILGKDVKVPGIPERLMLFQKLHVYISNYQYYIAHQTFLQNMKIGIKDKSFIYPNIAQTTHVTTFYLVFWTNVSLDICLHVYVYMFSLSGSQNNSAVYRHNCYNIYIRYCHCYNLLLFLPSRLLSLSAERILEEELYLSIFAECQRHSR